MSLLSLLLLLIFFLSALPISFSLQPPPPPPPRGTLIDCGATLPSVIDGRQWLPDNDFISVGTAKNVTTAVLLPILSTLRSFPLLNNLRRKFCYVVPVFRGAKYMVRTTYFYGRVNGAVSPPVFDQIVDGTLWSLVNTTEDYANGMASYYEGIFVAKGKKMSVCIAANTYTASDPFLSALEFVILGGSLYNSTDFKNFGLHLVARHGFGYNGSIIRYPDDEFDRFWEPYGESNISTTSNRSLPISGFWNLPASRIFNTAMKTIQPELMELKWPPVSLSNSIYYIALYFADDRDSSEGGSRMLDISINGITYYRNLNLTPAGVVVFASQWPLVGPTTITLTSAAKSNIGPLINGGEIFQLLLLGGRTLTRDVKALEAVKKNLENPPHDWNGDPCFPREYSWTGVACSEGPRVRVVTLNLTSMGLSGSLSPSLANMTALTGIWLGNNSLSGSLPVLSSLKMLEALHLENNQLSGQISSSYGDMQSLRELNFKTASI